MTHRSCFPVVVVGRLLPHCLLKHYTLGYGPHRNVLPKVEASNNLGLGVRGAGLKFLQHGQATPNC